ncbi:MAG: metal-dependent transcriptional regulator [Chitinophagaceae bacterium]
MSITEENYLKAIYALLTENNANATNQSIADKLQINPASVTDMLKKLNDKQLIAYNRKTGAQLTETGMQKAIQLIRKHRLWETLLVQHLRFSWQEVHEVAEQLEHIQSEKLTYEIDHFLGYPQFDPHGDPIPNAAGELPNYHPILLAKASLNTKYQLSGVSEQNNHLLAYLDSLSLTIGSKIMVQSIIPFDNSIEVTIHNSQQCIFSYKLANTLWVLPAIE